MICVSIRKDVDTGFVFPSPVPLERYFIDYLEDDVDEKYFLSNEGFEYLTKHDEECREKGYGFRFEPQERELATV